MRNKYARKPLDFRACFTYNEKAEQSFDLRKKRAPVRLKGERQGGETRAAEDAEGYENSRAESS